VAERGPRLELWFLRRKEGLTDFGFTSAVRYCMDECYRAVGSAVTEEPSCKRYMQARWGAMRELIG
jgi:hypothetical protein